MAKPRKKWLGILAFLGVVFLFLGNAYKVIHWQSIGWVCVSYPPWLPVTLWGGWAVMIATFYFTKAREHWYLKVFAAFYFVMNLLLSWCILNTYWGG